MVLKARLSTTRDGSLAEAGETRLDTLRIQQALDQCPPGQAVALRADGAANAFLSGPLHLRAGVTLLVDANTILFGSRNPGDYDVSPGSCGKVDDNGRGCKPLIGADHVPNAAVMGEGTIDGRGGARLMGRLTGKNVSWWDLASSAKKRPPA